jgi:malto-oligosyltrehalose synthase
VTAADTSGSFSHLGSTYRVQLAGLGFAGASRIVPSLSRLGVETLYCSPILRAVPGSTHGYDVIDPTALDPALGTPEDFETLLTALAAQRMRLLIDIVPNHLAAHPDNAWWWDIQRAGQRSPHAAVFDIDWSAHAGRVLLPTLGRPLAEVVAAGTSAVRQQGGAPVLELAGQSFPLRPDTDQEPTAGPLSAEATLALLDQQHYRPAFWRLSGDEGNYRRFFDIDGLVGVRVDDPAVFDATHSLLLALAADERVAGVRVDHIDGLAAPSQYLGRLRHSLRQRRSTEAAVLVEKIVARGERLPDEWDVDGTTGYEFADLAFGLFLDQEGTDKVQAHVSAPTFETLAIAAKREVLATSFGAHLDRLVVLAAHALDDTCAGHDLSPASLRLALVELTVQLPVYRTYLEHGPEEQSAKRVRATARGALADEPARAVDALVDGLTSGVTAWNDVVRRWQQLTGAVMAKGVEDTAGYRWPGLLAQADVGSEPDQRAVSPQAFAGAMAERLRHPLSLNTTSTHDSKRSEDVRSRLYALSEWGPEWVAQLEDWRARRRDWSASHRGLGRQTEHLVYQTLIAMWPPAPAPAPDADAVRRIEEYLVKAAREAKMHSSWTDPDPTYEDTLVRFVRFLALDGGDPSFAADAQLWAARLGPPAATISLSLAVLKAVSPGVPDIYQGNETWTYALTDPDNRRPVDFGALDQAIESLTDHPDTDVLLRNWTDGGVKLHVVHRLLTLRRRQPEFFACGGVRLLETNGDHRRHALALARHSGDRWVIAVIPRLTRAVAPEAASPFVIGPDVWADTYVQLPPDAPTHFVNELRGDHTVTARGGRLAVADVLAVLPVAVLTALT